MELSRRGFIGGLIAVAAPAVITTPGLLMPVRPLTIADQLGPALFELSFREAKELIYLHSPTFIMQINSLGELDRFYSLRFKDGSELSAPQVWRW